MKIKKNIKNIITMYYVKEMIFVSPCRRTLTKLIIYISCFVLVFFIFSIIQISRQFYESMNAQKVRYPTDLKYILFWKKPITNRSEKLRFNHAPKFIDGQSMFIKQRCKFINCFITHNKYLLRKDHQNLDAVVFDVRDIMDFSINEFDLTRSADQKYIFRSLHSSENYPICDPFFDNFFNWTWTYKLNSDIPQPLINIYNSRNELVGPNINMAWNKKMIHKNRFFRQISSKTKAVAWIVNKCKMKRKYQDFVRELKKELKSYNYTLDIYGTCGDNMCPGSSITKCLKMIEMRYFFQLIVEDTFAEDYVSERMVRAMTRIVIPIVLGTSDYNNFLPPGSYINAQTFDMKKLGAIIDYLLQNRNTYKHFFDWKNHYYYTVRPRSLVCDLCEKLNNFNQTYKSTIRKDFRKWWNSDYKNACQKRFHKIYV
ncbi:unnamed protein product [Euphydryas editha]|uniref:Fucosyltransferase n=1 Tax=Euphydryas editha TaxID=104508 RepID=A0AAU9TL96_EUPED|nr:unnamed protein product [Euphydryas editha]